MLKIISVRDATDGEWDDSWHGCEYATYYHSREWAEIWQSYTHGKLRALPKIIAFSDGKIIVMPLMYQNYYGKVIKRYGLVGPPSEVNAKYGNWLSRDKLTDSHVVMVSKYLMENYKNLIWQLNPYDDNSLKVVINSRYTKKKTFTWYMIDLTRGEKYILSHMKQTCRNKINQAIQNNLVVKEGLTLDDWKHYYYMYRDTLARWGSTALYRFDWMFFELLYEKYNKYNKLWLTWYDNIPISGCICFYSNRKVFIFQSASLSRYRYLRPVNLEKYIIIKDGIDKGYRWLDFGTAGKNKGLQMFKESFGPEEKMCDMIFSWHPIIYNIKKYFK
jgi:hypothetical protein